MTAHLWFVVCSLATGGESYADLRRVWEAIVALDVRPELKPHVAVWWKREAGWQTDIVNAKSGACGPLQIMPMWFAGHTCEEIRHDTALGLALGAAALESMIAKCGSTRAGLQAFSSGRCNGVPDLVRWRMSLAGAP